MLQVSLCPVPVDAPFKFKPNVLVANFTKFQVYPTINGLALKSMHIAHVIYFQSIKKNFKK